MVFKRLYCRLITNSYRPYILKKINIWNILNKRHTNVGELSIYFIKKNISNLSMSNIKTINLYAFNKPYIILSALVIIYLLSIVLWSVCL